MTLAAPLRPSSRVWLRIRAVLDHPKLEGRIYTAILVLAIATYVAVSFEEGSPLWLEVLFVVYALTPALAFSALWARRAVLARRWARVARAAGFRRDVWRDLHQGQAGFYLQLDDHVVRATREGTRITLEAKPAPPHAMPEPRRWARAWTRLPPRSGAASARTELPADPEALRRAVQDLVARGRGG